MSSRKEAGWGEEGDKVNSNSEPWAEGAQSQPLPPRPSGARSAGASWSDPLGQDLQPPRLSHPSLASPTWGRWRSLRGQARGASGALHRGHRWRQGQEQRGGRACKRACQRLPVVPAPPASGWVETHMAGGSRHHHTGTWWDWAKAGLVQGAGRQEAPGRNGGVCVRSPQLYHQAAPTSPVLTSAPRALTTCQAPFTMLYIGTHSIRSLKQPPKVGTVSSPFYR